MPFRLKWLFTGALRSDVPALYRLQSVLICTTVDCSLMVISLELLVRNLYFSVMYFHLYSASDYKTYS